MEKIFLLIIKFCFHSETCNDLQIYILKSLQDQRVHTLAEVKESTAKRFNISDSERKKMSSKKLRPIFDSTIIQKLSELRKKGFIVNESRGVFKITKAGLTESNKN